MATLTTVTCWNRTTYTRYGSTAIGSGFNARSQIHQGEISQDGCTAIKILFPGRNTTGLHIKHAAIGICSTSSQGAYVSTDITPITFNSGDASITVPKNSCVWSDLLTFDWTTDQSYMIHCYMGVTANWTYMFTTGGQCTYGAWKLTTVDETTIQDVSGYTDQQRVHFAIRVDGQIYVSSASANLFFAHG